MITIFVVRAQLCKFRNEHFVVVVVTVGAVDSCAVHQGTVVFRGVHSAESLDPSGFGGRRGLFQWGLSPVLGHLVEENPLD